MALFYAQINGSLTLGENIADNGGIHASFQVCMYSVHIQNSDSLFTSISA